MGEDRTDRRACGTFLSETAIRSGGFRPAEATRTGWRWTGTA